MNDENLKPFGFLTLKTNRPANWVGGGAFSHTAKGQWIMDKNLELKRAIYVARSGHLASSRHQGIVLISEGDYFCSFDGRREEIGNSEVSSPECVKIEKIQIIDGKPLAKLTKVDLSWEDMPKRVIKGLNIYHNRDASYFCKKEVS